MVCMCTVRIIHSKSCRPDGSQGHNIYIRGSLAGFGFLKVHITDTTNTCLATSMDGKNKSTNEKRPARARNEKNTMPISNFCHSIPHVVHTRADAQEMVDLRPLVVIRAPIFCMGVGERMSGGGGDHMWTA